MYRIFGLAGAYLVGLWIAYAVLVQGLIDLGMSVRVTGLFVVLVSVPLTLAGLDAWRYWFAKSMQAALKSAGRCPSCRYKPNCAPDRDGCIVCPECGRAWRLGDERREGVV